MKVQWQVNWAIVFVVPIIFILMRAVEVEMSVPRVNSAIKAVFAVWPALSSQYSALDASATDLEGDRYLAFVAVTLFVNIVFVLAILFLSVRSGLRKVNETDLLVVLLLLPGAGYGLWFNVAKSQPDFFWDFYIDNYGLYYIREFLMIHLVFLFASMAVVLFLSAVIRSSED